MNALSGPKRSPFADELGLTSEDEIAMREQWRATEQLYLEEAPQLARYFERRVPKDDVLDMVQESFRRIIGHRPIRPGAFLGRTAANLVIEFRRAAARRRVQHHVPFDERDIPGTDPHPELEARDALARIDLALKMLKPKTRNIFLLARIEGKSYAEVGEMFGMSEEGVTKQVAKAMWHLRRRVGDL